MDGRELDERDVPGADIVVVLVKVSMWLRNRFMSDITCSGDVDSWCSRALCHSIARQHDVNVKSRELQNTMLL